MRGSSEPSYAMFVKRTRPEDKGDDFRFHPHNPEVSGSNPLPAAKKNQSIAYSGSFSIAGSGFEPLTSGL